MLKPSSEYLTELRGYVENGIKIVVSTVYPFQSFGRAYTEVPDAIYWQGGYYNR